MDNISHNSKGGEKKILNQKLDFKSKASSKIGSTENLNHKPAGGDVKIYNAKLDFKQKATPKVGSTEKLSHTPQGGRRVYNDRKCQDL